ncbi:MAG: hypothetical protein GY876_07650 [Planctomycetes bacterium]|nr:hypothetical protein [Planctomycetota bacterium]
MLDLPHQLSHYRSMPCRAVVMMCLAAMFATSGCGPEETRSMRVERATRASEASDRRMLLQQGREDTASQLRELGVGRR